MSAIHTDPAKRHDFVYLFDVVNGNPNGDPDAGNLPRLDPETMHGLVTDVCLKRKVRDYAALVGQQPIFIQSQTALNTIILKAFHQVGIEPPKVLIEDDELQDWFAEVTPEFFSMDEGYLSYAGDSVKPQDIGKLLQASLADDAPANLKDKLNKLAKDLANAAKGGKSKITRKDRGNAQKQLCTDFFDIRLFGAVLATGPNAGQVRGPMQLTFARSISPIVALDLSITRQARTTVARMETGPTEMARKPLVPYGLYRAKGFFSPYLAERTGVKEADLQLFWEALQNMFEHDRSAARGEMACRGLYIFTHDRPQGAAPAHKLFDLIQVDEHNSIPRQFGDYRVTAPSPGPLAAFPEVTLTVLGD